MSFGRNVARVVVGLDVLSLFFKTYEVTEGDVRKVVCNFGILFENFFHCVLSALKEEIKPTALERKSAFSGFQKKILSSDTKM